MNRIPKELASLLAAAAAAGLSADIVAIPLGPRSPEFKDDVRAIHPRTYQEIMNRPEFSDDERELARLLFHRSGAKDFANHVVSFGLECSDEQFERLAQAFPKECGPARIVRDMLGRMAHFTNRVIDLDKFITKSASKTEGKAKPAAQGSGQPIPVPPACNCDGCKRGATDN